MSMNPIFDKLYTWIRSELDWDRDFFGMGGDSGRGPRDSGRDWKDPDLAAAEEELEEFLRGPGPKSTGRRNWSDEWGRGQENATAGPQDRAALALAQAYLELGLAPGATWDDVKDAHRSLLRKHHPDRHGPDKSAVEEATRKTQRINEAFQIIKKALGKI